MPQGEGSAKTSSSPGYYGLIIILMNQRGTLSCGLISAAEPQGLLRLCGVSGDGCGDGG